MTTPSVESQEAMDVALCDVIFKLKVEIEHGQCATILSSVLVFVLFFFVCLILFYQCLETIQPASPDFPTYLNTEG